VCLGVLLRLSSINWGWPYSLYPDEQLYMPNALRMAAQRTLNPSFFNNSHLYTYICVLEIGVIYIGGKLAGIFPDAATFGNFVWCHSSHFIFWRD